jgi:hypothetical protein
MIRSIAAAVALGLTVSGCGLSTQSRTTADTQASTEAYKACVRANPERPHDCDSARLVTKPPPGGQIMVLGQ